MSTRAFRFGTQAPLIRVVKQGEPFGTCVWTGISIVSRRGLYSRRELNHHQHISMLKKLNTNSLH